MANRTAISPAGRMINCSVSAVIWVCDSSKVDLGPFSQPRPTVGHGHADRDHRAGKPERDGGARAAGECIKPTGPTRYASIAAGVAPATDLRRVPAPHHILPDL